MRLPALATALGAGAAALAGCHPAPLGHARGAADRPVSVAATLDCPDSVEGFTLGQRAADGASCSYGGPDGARLRLTRMALSGGSAQATLASLDAQARALVPGAPGGRGDGASLAVGTGGGESRTTTTTVRTDTTTDGDDAPAPPAPPAPPPPPSGSGDHVRLDLPGLHIDADGDRARVSGFGQHVEADGDRAVVHGGIGGLSSSVVADSGGTMVRTGGAGARSVDAALVLASEAAGPDGWRAAGYVARGPLGGPLVVAQVQARGGSRNGGGGPFDAAHRLVDRNTGG